LPKPQRLRCLSRVWLSGTILSRRQNVIADPSKGYRALPAPGSQRRHFYIRDIRTIAKTSEQAFRGMLDMKARQLGYASRITHLESFE
jgi:hypothetical protein